MSGEQRRFYLLGELGAKLVTFPAGSEKTLMEYHTIGVPGGQAIAIFLSRLDAEIHRQQLNRQSCYGRMNRFTLIDNRDSRVGIINEIGHHSCHLLCCFVTNAAKRPLIGQDGSYLPLHFRLRMRDQKWMLDGIKEPDNSIMDSVRLMFANSEAPDYLDELLVLESLDEECLSELARAATQHEAASSAERMGFPAVFSPQRMAWVPLSFGRPQ